MDDKKLKDLYIKYIKSSFPKSFYSLNEEDKVFFDKKDNSYTLKKELRTKITVVLTGGVFDVIHPGHLSTLNEAKLYGDILVVVVASDETVLKTKSREPLHSQEQRVDLVNSLKPVDIAVAGQKDWRETLKLISPDIVAFGYDQKIKDIKNTNVVKLTSHIAEKWSKTKNIRNILGI